MTEQLRDITITNLTIDLLPQEGKIPVAPIVYTLDISLTSSVLEKAVAVVLAMTKEKQPVDVELESAKFTEGGAEIQVSAGLNRFLKAKATAEVTIVAASSATIAVSLSDLRTLGKIPIDGIAGPAIESALTSAAEIPGITRDPSVDHGLLIEPNTLLAHFGVPLTFAPGGGWTVVTANDSLTVRYGPIS